MSRLRQGAVIVWRATFVFTSLLLASCGEPSVADGKRLVTLGDSCYRIPVWNAQLVNASPFWPFFRKRESNRSLTLQFENAEIASLVPGYEVPRTTRGVQRQGMLVSLFLPTPQEARQARENKRRMHVDIWYGDGAYATRTVEPIPGTELYRVSPLPNGHTWMVVTGVPDVEQRDTHLADDFWIGGCFFIEQLRSCTTDVNVNGLILTLHTSEENLPRRQHLARYVVDKLESWEVPCDG